MAAILVALFSCFLSKDVSLKLETGQNSNWDSFYGRIYFSDFCVPKMELTEKRKNPFRNWFRNDEGSQMLQFFCRFCSFSSMCGLPAQKTPLGVRNCCIQ